MFVIPSYKALIENWKEKQSQLLQLCDNIEFDNFKSEATTSFYKKDENVKHNVTEGVVNILKRDIQKFGREFDLRNLSVDYAWFQKYNDGQFHVPHNHGSRGWSCIVYVKFDPTVHSATQFIAPFNGLTGDTIVRKPEVTEGTILFFPSMLLHFVSPTDTDKTRIILSFNLKEQGKMKKQYYFAL